jgi:hypothetical protein
MNPLSNAHLINQLDDIVMAIANYGHQVINEQHSEEKSYVYGTPRPLVITRVEAVPMLMELFATAKTQLLHELIEQLPDRPIGIGPYSNGYRDYHDYVVSVIEKLLEEK